MRRLLAVVLVAGVSWSIYLAADSGPVGTQRIAECPVRLSDEAIAIAQDAGLSVHRYERVRFSVFVSNATDGGTGKDVDLPQAMARVARFVEVFPGWDACTLSACTLQPVICTLWDAGLPLRLAPSRTCVRQRADAGLPCLRLGVDGGFDFGDMNVFPRAEAVNPATCEQTECAVYGGEEGEL